MTEESKMRSMKQDKKENNYWMNYQMSEWMNEGIGRKIIYLTKDVKLEKDKKEKKEKVRVDRQPHTKTENDGVVDEENKNDNEWMTKK